MGLQYKDLQPWVDMLCDALENRGSSSSGIPDLKVYPYAQKYRDMLEQIRNKNVAMYHLRTFLNTNYNEIMSITTQPNRTKNILNALDIYFKKEYMRK